MKQYKNIFIYIFTLECVKIKSFQKLRQRLKKENKKCQCALDGHCCSTAQRK